jgi:hypothetical protein
MNKEGWSGCSTRINNIIDRIRILLSPLTEVQKSTSGAGFWGEGSNLPIIRHSSQSIDANSKAEQQFEFRDHFSSDTTPVGAGRINAPLCRAPSGGIALAGVPRATAERPWPPAYSRAAANESLMARHCEQAGRQHPAPPFGPRSLHRCSLAERWPYARWR